MFFDALTYLHALARVKKARCFPNGTGCFDFYSFQKFFIFHSSMHNCVFWQFSIQIHRGPFFWQIERETRACVCVCKSFLEEKAFYWVFTLCTKCVYKIGGVKIQCRQRGIYTQLVYELLVFTSLSAKKYYYRNAKPRNNPVLQTYIPSFFFSMKKTPDISFKICW